MLSSPIRRAMFAAVCVIAIANCNRRPVPEASAELAAVLGGTYVGSASPNSAKVWNDVRAFYSARQGDPAWISKLKMSKSAAAALDVIRTAPEHGLIAADYDEPKLSQLFTALEEGKDKAPDRLQLLAETDVRLTTALLALGRDVATGRTSPSQLTTTWKARRKAPDFAGTLAKAIDDDIKTWLWSMAPQHPEYAALAKALTGLRATQAAKPGTPAATFYDTRTPAGIKAFQGHHGLKETGTIDPATKAAIAVPIESRIRQIELNLERWRWMPDDFGKRHFMVNRRPPALSSGSI